MSFLDDEPPRHHPSWEFEDFRKQKKSRRQIMPVLGVLLVLAIVCGIAFLKQ